MWWWWEKNEMGRKMIFQCFCILPINFTFPYKKINKKSVLSLEKPCSLARCFATIIMDIIWDGRKKYTWMYLLHPKKLCFSMQIICVLPENAKTQSLPANVCVIFQNNYNSSFLCSPNKLCSLANISHFPKKFCVHLQIFCVQLT